MLDKIMESYIFIPHNIPSLKNSKQFTGKYLVRSKTVNKFLKLHGIKNYSSSKHTVDNYATIPDTFKQYTTKLKELLQNQKLPYKLEFYFARSTKHKFDFGNAVELLADLFTAYNVWKDDNCDNFLPFPKIINNSVYIHDKENPGVYIYVKKD